MTMVNQSPDTQFTVFIRLPFPRGNFVDPPPVEWNAAKDQALWGLLSRPSKGDDIDWRALAERFDVTLQFLLQQAAWLYDRQLSQVRAQMRKVGTTQSKSPSPAPGSISGSTALGPQGKGAPNPGSRAPTRLTTHQREAPPQRGKTASKIIRLNDGFLTRIDPAPRRTSSNTTINQIKPSRELPRGETPTGESNEPKRDRYGRRPSTSRREPHSIPPIHKSPTLEEEELTSSSSESESGEEDIMSSRAGLRFRHFGKFSTSHRPGLRDDEEDDDESPAFLPLARGRENAGRETTAQDLNATLRMEAEEPSAPRRRPEQISMPRKPITAESSTSSASSGAQAPLPSMEARRRLNQTGSGISPRRHAELARLSPRRSTASGRDASDTPSMGSSFSDLDDASVTQSALEEALMSNMQHGGMASRMSTISQALRSRYL
ncbi:hypothetical protein FE257_006969 [Aspergillus nanangensis]|uniref:Autophagy-related protein 29 n=1 Tax=Aspergillus nanangensis TaxID=2582783 RepID=A0AAD4CNN5_ASPNN|nr:hypothetical protein FE257_006969 [Aspergillus nanangensis]